MNYLLFTCIVIDGEVLLGESLGKRTMRHSLVSLWRRRRLVLIGVYMGRWEMFSSSGCVCWDAVIGKCCSWRRGRWYAPTAAGSSAGTTTAGFA